MYYTRIKCSGYSAHQCFTLPFMFIFTQWRTEGMGEGGGASGAGRSKHIASENADNCERPPSILPSILTVSVFCLPGENKSLRHFFIQVSKIYCLLHVHITSTSKFGIKLLSTKCSSKNQQVLLMCRHCKHLLAQILFRSSKADK